MIKPKKNVTNPWKVFQGNLEAIFGEFWLNFLEEFPETLEVVPGGAHGVIPPKTLADILQETMAESP